MPPAFQTECHADDQQTLYHSSNLIGSQGAFLLFLPSLEGHVLPSSLHNPPVPGVGEAESTNQLLNNQNDIGKGFSNCIKTAYSVAGS